MDFDISTNIDKALVDTDSFKNDQRYAESRNLRSIVNLRYSKGTRILFQQEVFIMPNIGETFKAPATWADLLIRSRPPGALGYPGSRVPVVSERLPEGYVLVSKDDAVLLSEYKNAVASLNSEGSVQESETPMTREELQDRYNTAPTKPAELQVAPSEDIVAVTDDLAQIKGIGPALKQRLSDIGINNIHDLAKSDADTLIELLQKGGYTSAPKARTWVESAKVLVNPK